MKCKFDNEDRECNESCRYYSTCSRRKIPADRKSEQKRARENFMRKFTRVN